MSDRMDSGDSRGHARGPSPRNSADVSCGAEHGHHYTALTIGTRHRGVKIPIFIVNRKSDILS